MRCPRKLYLVVSRKLQDDVRREDLFVSLTEATEEQEKRNRDTWDDVEDWRVETYVKGD